MRIKNRKTFLHRHSLSLVTAVVLCTWIALYAHSDPSTHWGALEDHSLSIFLVITGSGWVWLFATSDSNSRWGQVVGNIVSEWTQIFGIVMLTKHLLELHSKESK